MNKVTRFISAVSALMAISVSCAKQELPVSTFKMDSTAIVVPAGGGICSVPYQVASSDAGNAEVIRMAGEYTYDEEKGLIYLYDDSNTMEMYHKDVVISLKKDVLETVSFQYNGKDRYRSYDGA